MFGRTRVKPKSSELKEKATSLRRYAAPLLAIVAALRVAPSVGRVDIGDLKSLCAEPEK
jgi:hypothetical protein